MKPQVLTIDSEVLGEFRDNFNGTLAVLVREMKARGLHEGTITAKIDITIEEAADANGQIAKQLTIQPEVNMKMGAKGKVECSKRSGLFVQLNDDGVPVVGHCQIDIDELLAEEADA